MRKPHSRWKQKAVVKMSEWHPTDVLIHPVVSEKSMDIAAQGRYVFVVSPNATKADVRRAVRELYGVEVVKVNIINLPGKPKMWRMHRFRTPRRRKAIVTLAAGQSIPEITEAV